MVLFGNNDADEYPGVLRDFPAVKVSGGQFTGLDLLIELRKRGCVFYKLSYINSAEGAQQALSYFTTNLGKVVITSEVSGECTVTPATIPDLDEYSISTDSNGTTNLI